MQDRWTDGDAYETYVGRWSRRTAESFLAWLDPAPDLRWLDLGSGTGALAMAVEQNCAPLSVIGIEPSDGFIEQARANATGGMRFIPSDAGALPLEDDAIDFAVSGLVLNFIQDLPKALSELRRCVVEGGTIAAYVWDYAGHAQFIRQFWDAAAELDPAAQELHEGVRFPLCRPGALEVSFATAGLQEIEIAPIDIVTPFADFEDYWRPFLSGTGPAPGYCMSLDVTRRDMLKSCLSDRLPKDPEGRILMAARAWAIRGINPPD